MPRVRANVQRAFEFRTWGGARKGAGRKQVKARKSQPHRTRSEVVSAWAVHITLRVADDLVRLRHRDAYRAIRKAGEVVLGRGDFRIVHTSIQHNHIHLICEAETKMALARGLQAFQISAARRLNKAQYNRTGTKRKGPVFPDRYHVEIIKSPMQMRRALCYVLNNWRKHSEHRASAAKTWVLDPYSSAVAFDGWNENPSGRWKLSKWYEPLPVCRPQSWLLRAGWKLHGSISIHEIPGRR